MIVNQVQDGWEIIYHRAHALLAAQVGGAWLADTRPGRWVEIMAAIAGHDDLAREWESPELTEAGAPEDFRLHEGTSVDSLRELVTYARYRGRFVALLTSMHTSFLCEPERGKQKPLDTFLDEQRELQEEWRRALKLSKKDAQAAYDFMQWCDRLSLILCMKQIPARERRLEIITYTDGQRYEIQQRPDGTLLIDPWPFAQDTIEVAIEFTALKQLKFKNSAELSKALQQAEISTHVWEFSRHAQSSETKVTAE